MNTLDPRFLEDLTTESVDEIDELVGSVLDSLIVNGVTYGDVNLQSDEDFTMWYLSLVNHKDDMGMTYDLRPYIATVNPRFSAEWQRRFDRTAGRLMGVR